MAQEDHLETEEALVLPLVREQMNDQEQLEVIKGLLIDEVAEDPRWVIDWVYGELDPKERELLSEVEARFSESAVSVG